MRFTFVSQIMITFLLLLCITAILFPFSLYALEPAGTLAPTAVSETAGARPATVGAEPAMSPGDVELFNPLGKSSLYDIANAILDILMVFAVPIILFFIVWAGFLYVTANGNETQISKATKALMYAVIGGVIVLGAKVLLEVITNTVNVFGN